MQNNIFDINKDVYLGTNVGLVREANEDNHGNKETINGQLFVVCDGMGGSVGGATASKIAVDSIIEYFGNEKFTNIRQALKDALVFANIQIFATATENKQLKGMGTTAVIVLIQKSKVWYAHIGDSRLYIWNNNVLKRVTKDHSLVQKLVDAREMTEERAEIDDQKNIILRALGTKNEIIPEICEAPIEPKNNDIFMICSDGLNGMVPDLTMAEVFKEKISIKEKGEKLMKMALDGGGEDNVTTHLINITNSKKRKHNFTTNNTPAANLKSATFIEKKEKKIVKETKTETKTKTKTENETKTEIKPTNPKKKKKGIWIVLSMLSVVALIIAGVFIGKELGNKEYNVNYEETDDATKEQLKNDDIKDNVVAVYNKNMEKITVSEKKESREEAQKWVTENYKNTSDYNFFYKSEKIIITEKKDNGKKEDPKNDNNDAQNNGKKEEQNNGKKEEQNNGKKEEQNNGKKEEQNNTNNTKEQQTTKHTITTYSFDTKTTETTETITNLDNFKNNLDETKNYKIDDEEIQNIHYLVLLDDKIVGAFKEKTETSKCYNDKLYAKAQTIKKIERKQINIDGSTKNNDYNYTFVCPKPVNQRYTKIKNGEYIENNRKYLYKAKAKDTKESLTIYFDKLKYKTDDDLNNIQVGNKYTFKKK